MKLLSNAKEIKHEFKTLMTNYQEYHWATAWADFDFDLSDLLVAKRKRIKKVVVGLSFYATHIEFLNKFQTHLGVKFIANDSAGTFHPKLYLFQNSAKDWRILLGSGNFKRSAFGNNTEVFVLISPYDSGSEEVYKSVNIFIEEQWKTAIYLTKNYIEQYGIRKQKVKESHPPLPKSPQTSQPVYNWTWSDYVKNIRKGQVKNRADLISWAQQQFTNKSFDKLDIETRKGIAGFEKRNGDLTYEDFGTVNMRYEFKSTVRYNPKVITRALKNIPRKGEVRKEDYGKFIDVFRDSFSDHELAAATRLLCLWRPDYFVTFNTKNKEGLSDKLKIRSRDVNYETYWDKVVEPIRNCGWSELKPAAKDKTIHDYRVALLDCIYYDEESIL